MTDEDLHLKLLADEPINVNGVGDIYSPSLREIVRLGLEKYSEALSSLMFNKNKIDSLKHIDESNFIVACYFFHQDSDFRESFKNGVGLVLKKDIHMEEINERPILVLDNDYSITEHNFDEFQNVIRVSNRLSTNTEDEEFKAGNSKAREMIEKIKKGKLNKPKKKPIVNLHSLISGLSWKSTSGINITNVFDLSIYRFYDGYYRLENIEHYNNTLTGIYSGNIDMKKINMEEINWAKIIK